MDYRDIIAVSQFAFQSAVEDIAYSRRCSGEWNGRVFLRAVPPNGRQDVPANMDRFMGGSPSCHQVSHHHRFTLPIH